MDHDVSATRAQPFAAQSTWPPNPLCTEVVVAALARRAC